MVQVEFEELRTHLAGQLDPITEERSELGSSSTIGNSPPPPPMRLPSTLSTENENKAAIGKMFAHYDADGSGQISVAELVPLLQDLGVISAGDVVAWQYATGGGIQRPADVKVGVAPHAEQREIKGIMVTRSSRDHRRWRRGRRDGSATRGDGISLH